MDLEEHFDNHFDCYTREGDTVNDVPAMSKARFIELVQKLSPCDLKKNLTLMDKLTIKQTAEDIYLKKLPPVKLTFKEQYLLDAAVMAFELFLNGELKE